MPDLLKLARSEALDAKDVWDVIAQVRSALKRWKLFADEVGMPTLTRAKIEPTWPK